jgi:hypothetical protein
MGRPCVPVAQHNVTTDHWSSATLQQEPQFLQQCWPLQCVTTEREWQAITASRRSSVMKIQVFWNVMPCWLVNNYPHFEGACCCCLCHQSPVDMASHSRRHSQHGCENVECGSTRHVIASYKPLLSAVIVSSSACPCSWFWYWGILNHCLNECEVTTGSITKVGVLTWGNPALSNPCICSYSGCSDTYRAFFPSDAGGHFPKASRTSEWLTANLC